MSAPRFGTKSPSVTASQESPYWGEHIARYSFAAAKISGGRILDVACGTGYGLPLFEAVSEMVVGVELDWNAALQARSAINGGRSRIFLADGCRLPFADASFDFVTSFETLEHLNQRVQFLSELRRVLSPQGLCILSTPNAKYTLPVNGKPRNPFHVYEYPPEELRDELARHFTVADMLGQTLNPCFRIPPFWEAQQRLPRTPGMQARLFVWRAMNKMPIPIRERMSRAVWRRPFYPAETDYRFDATTVETAPVLIAICHPRDERGKY